MNFYPLGLAIVCTILLLVGVFILFCIVTWAEEQIWWWRQRSGDGYDSEALRKIEERGKK